MINAATAVGEAVDAASTPLRDLFTGSRTGSAPQTMECFPTEAPGGAMICFPTERPRPQPHCREERPAEPCGPRPRIIDLFPDGGCFPIPNPRDCFPFPAPMPLPLPIPTWPRGGCFPTPRLPGNFDPQWLLAAANPVAGPVLAAASAARSVVGL